MPDHPPSEDMDEVVDEILVRLSQEFVDATLDLLDEIDQKIDALEKGQGRLDEVMDYIRREIHNIKGQGSSFGYQLMTNIGGSLCDYIRDCEPTSEAGLKVIEAHLAALEFVIDREIKGDGGDAGQGLIDKLKGYVDNET